MANKYYLNKKDQEFLIKECGYLQDDMAQIQRTINRAKFEHYKGEYLVGEISPKESIELLGLTDFLTGVARAAFHFSASRYIHNSRKNYVSIDNYKMLSELTK